MDSETDVKAAISSAAAAAAAANDTIVVEYNITDGSTWSRYDTKNTFIE